jgi:uncharacterized coiled-coil DUF342 family protein
MKLAEALILRADCQKRISQLRERLERVVKVEEGDSPAEDPQTLLAEVDRIIENLTQLIQQINRTNSQTPFANLGTLADALAERDTLRIKSNLYREVIKATFGQNHGFFDGSVSARASVRTVNVAELQTQVDRLAQQARELDTRIQEANWTIELLE